MYAYMGHMEERHLKPYEDHFWEKNEIDLVHAWVKNIDFDSKKAFLENGVTLTYDKLILALGSKPRMIDWPGKEAGGIQGLYSLKDLQLMEKQTKGIQQAVIIGGGLIGIEMAEMLHSRGIGVDLLIREPHYWGNVLPAEEGQLIGNHLADNKISLHPETGITRIESDAKGHISGLVTSKGAHIPCQFLGVSIGVQPNIGLVQDTSLACNSGILINAYFETNITDVYAIGDCAEHQQAPAGRAKVEQVWYTGRIMGEQVAKNILGEKQPYQPGLWFNSAKFFDIEYQVYGHVPAEPAPDKSFYWEDSKQARCLRFYFDERNYALEGIHAFGIRLRHEVCERWITQGTPLDKVMASLAQADFDAEFGKDWVSLVQAHAQKQLDFLEIPAPKKPSIWRRWFS
jgi:NADPH-dependent 2,4-dienoyl-CoA reductase/sulfur reductase-like enzyme